MKHTTSVARATFVLSAVLFSACDGPDEPSITTTAALPLMGGVAANSPSLDAIGALLLARTQLDCNTGKPFTQTIPICTATLIAPQVAVTAKHCLNEANSQLEPGMELELHLGYDRMHPRRRVQVIDWEVAKTFTGGWTQIGHDVAALMLAERVDDVTPIALATPDRRLIGKRLSGVGYGLQNISRASGTRMAGSVTVNAFEGRVYESIFQSNFDAFGSWYREEDPTAAELELRTVYDSALLLSGYELHAGARTGDAQPCRGDSGGPLLDFVDGQAVSYGVTSGGLRSVSMICAGGAVYATFGPDTLAMLARARAWKDPCGGLSMRGACDGAVARRCTHPSEGPRRLIAVDCTSLGEICVTDSDDRAVCAAPFEKPITSSANSSNQCPESI